MKRIISTTLVAALFLLSRPLYAQPFRQAAGTSSAGEIIIRCDDTDGWKFHVEVENAEKEYVRISLSRESPAAPPKFSLRLETPQVDIQHFWSPNNDSPALCPDWGGKYDSQLARGIPVYEFLNGNCKNRLTMALDDSFRQIDLIAGVREETASVMAEFSFFNKPEAPLDRYELTLMLDARPVFWSESIREAAEWISGKIGHAPFNCPEEAFEPVYSSWYQFHQNVSAVELEREAVLASELGMKTLILDDGWQTDDARRDYALCGDWEVSAKKFPDMAGHVRKVREAGLKYMMWYSIPFIGFESRNHERFKGKYLYDNNGLKASVLDPRFPEVREFLSGIYEKAAKEWGLDGFKFDFIGSMVIDGKDPALDDNYAGRDIKSVQEATDLLMRTVSERLREINPDILIEFRQKYIGPAIRRYGNMFRASDCPGNMQANRIRTANLRLTSGRTAVHSDMLEWNADESPEDAAGNIISSIFSVIQYSVMLRDIPESHRKMLKNWIEFSRTHRNTLLKGTFKPYHCEAGYPVIEASGEDETIIAVYQGNVCADIDNGDGRTVYVLNGSGGDSILVGLNADAAEAVISDAFGNEKAGKAPKKGLNNVHIPKGGYLKLTFQL